MRTFALRLVLAAAALAMVAAPAAADTYNFTCITNNSATDCGIGVAQLAVNVTDAGNNQVSFQFTNTGSSAAVIAEIYFGYFGTDPNLLASIVTPIATSSGVSFVLNASPPALPGGNAATPPFVTIATLTAQAKNPAPKNGVGPGEAVTVLVNLNNGVTFADVISSLNLGNAAVGIHVVSFDSGGSESLTTTCSDPNGCTPVPEPASLALFGTGLLGLAGVIRRKFLS